MNTVNKDEAEQRRKNPDWSFILFKLDFTLYLVILFVDIEDRIGHPCMHISKVSQ